MDEQKLSDMTVEELAAARENASEEEKAAIDAELERRMQAEDEGGEGGEGGNEAEMKADGGDDAGEMPYGSQVLSAAFEAMSTILADVQQASRTVEQPDAKAELDALVETLEGCRSSIAQTYSDVYPEAPQLAGAGDQVEPTEDTAVLKSFIAMGRDRQARALGVIGRIENAVRMSPTAAMAAGPALKSLRAMFAQAKGEAARRKSTMSPVLQEMELLKKSLKKL